MKINNISICNFRNYENLCIDFNEGINIFIGNNGVGKTNILESIYVLAITKSHRSYIDKNLINSSKNIMKLSGKVESNKCVKFLELFMNNKGKRVSIDKIVYKKISDYISNLLVILFSPDDLELIKGSPSVRRKYMNIEIGQLDNKYLNYLNEYNNLLKNRNEYLKSISIDNIDMNYIGVLNFQICEKASMIYKYRYEYIANLNRIIDIIFNELSEGKLSIKYLNNIDCNSYVDYKEKLLEKLDSNLKREIIMGTTLYGPHRDDIEFYLNDNNVREYGSQGQQRLCILAMKFAECEYFKEKIGEYPVLLLDDIFSELDILKRNSIIKYLNKGIQVFITTTDINDIDECILSNSKIYSIIDNNIVC